MYVKQDFNGTQLAMLFQAFNKSLFTRPKVQDILTVPHGGDSGCTFFFRREYVNVLLHDMTTAKNAGKFASSNANLEWNNLLDSISSATISSETEYRNASDYASECSMFWH